MIMLAPRAAGRKFLAIDLRESGALAPNDERPALRKSERRLAL
jgi:hypothetical protein